MDKFLKELCYFNNTYNILGCRKSIYIKDFLEILLDCSSVDTLKKCYYSNYKKFNLEYKTLQRDLDLQLPLEEIKYRVVTCSINKLHSFQSF